MPLYEYRCEACEHQFEVIRKFSDGPIAVCPKCAGGPVVKLLSSPAFQFKGTGWYVTDYARKDGAKSADSTGADEKPSESKPAESKPASTDSASTNPSPTTTSKSEGS
jgi:putative FmdB family regulatory protein